MEQQKEKGKLYQLWLSFSIKQKLCTFAGAVIIAILLAVISNLATIDYALYGIGTTMDDNVKCSALLEAVSNESRAFETYVRLRTEENRLVYENACEITRLSVEALPYDYELIGDTRYARTWSIRNFYNSYVEARDQFLTEEESGSEYVNDLYQVYRLQGYLDTYSRRLVLLTTQEGNDDYLRREPILSLMSPLLLSVASVIVCLILLLTFWMWRSLVTPLEQLAQVSRKIAVNEFPDTDVQVENQDEMGELVVAFNKMKHATVGYIEALEEKYAITQLLHKEELERVEMEKSLDAAKLEVLKSQINPHFLFNTLNMVACMAKLEEARTSERMITSLSNIFRYNLKTVEAEVTLAQEIKVVDDYMYLQQMRFGDRVQYIKSVECSGIDTFIPSLSLQPIVENAIIHGLARKEQGGKLCLKARLRNRMLVISIIDTGTGIDRDTLKQLRQAMGKQTTSRIGIGIGNIYKRLQMMYGNADLLIYSKKGIGTIVQMKIPQNQ